MRLMLMSKSEYFTLHSLLYLYRYMNVHIYVKVPSCEASCMMYVHDIHVHDIHSYIHTFIHNIYLGLAERSKGKK